MIEIVFLIICTTGIAAYARARGGNPVYWSALSVGGYILIVYVLPTALRLAPHSETRFWMFPAGLGWMGVMALCTRFLIGSGRPKPSGMWVCPNCRFLNQHYAVLCDACQRPYGETKAST